MNKDDDINNYLPSLLNPRSVKKSNDFTLTQHSIVSCRSLSLKRPNTCSILKPIGNKAVQNNNFVHKKDVLQLQANETIENNSIISALEEINPVLNPISNKENSKNLGNNNGISQNNLKDQLQSNTHNEIPKNNTLEENSIRLSGIEDLSTILVRNVQDSNSFGFDDIEIPPIICASENKNHCLISLSSATELNNNGGSQSDCTTSTVKYEITEKTVLSVSFGLYNCDNLNLSSKKSNIKKINVKRKNNATEVDCVLEENTTVSIASSTDENMNELSPTPPKKSAVAINLEIKKRNDIENSKLLFLNTNDIGNLSHVIVQPPNCKLVKRQILDHKKFRNSAKRNSTNNKNGKIARVGSLKQKRIDSYFRKSGVNALLESVVDANGITNNNGAEMNKVAGVALGANPEGVRSNLKARRDVSVSPRSAQQLPKRETQLPTRRHSARGYLADNLRIPSPRAKNATSKGESGGSTPALNADLTPSKNLNVKKIPSNKNVPPHKIVAGTHFAVDAFSYGDIPNITFYFLTHFHSDHYAGLKKSFNHTLYCSKITGDLCTSRLGVNPKCIQILQYDETVVIDDVEVTALDANHCPGAVMLVFNLPNGKTMLHTGDFRASPIMESYPVFWNRDINTIYLDTTYCNPRYDFPTQEQSLEMALYILRQKKLALEQAGKKFTSVLIVCGTYTIGKEKFFLGIARRVGCAVWACPEKDRILQTVEGRSFGHAPPQSCQLHVVPMRDLTHEKLRSYLESMQGAFSEVVAFKPSGWENGRNTVVGKDNVAIHEKVLSKQAIYRNHFDANPNTTAEFMHWGAIAYEADASLRSILNLNFDGIPYSEHSSFSELIRFVKFLKPKQVVPTVDITGGIAAIQQYFPCPLVYKCSSQNQMKVTDFFENAPPATK